MRWLQPAEGLTGCMDAGRWDVSASSHGPVPCGDSCGSGERAVDEVQDEGTEQDGEERSRGQLHPRRVAEQHQTRVPGARGQST